MKIYNAEITINGEKVKPVQSWNESNENVKTNRELKHIRDSILSHFNWRGYRRYLMIKAIRSLKDEQ